jgi:hypothetical protein
MKELPSVPDPLVDTESSDAPLPVSPAADRANSTAAASSECTHINLFSFLRLLLHLYDEERIQRAAAIRLMFETASVGALTPQTSVTGSTSADASQHVEFPQVPYPMAFALKRDIHEKQLS